MHTFKNKLFLFLNDTKADDIFFNDFRSRELDYKQSMDNEDFSESQRKQMSSFSFSSWHCLMKTDV